MIRFDSVVKSFGERTILNGLNFEAQKGEIVFVLGTSGTGKSVLLKCIVGLLRLSSGKIFINNEEVSALTEQEYLSVRRRCGMVFQHPALFDSLSVFENVAFGIRKHKLASDSEDLEVRVNRCLDLVNLGHLRDEKPAQLSYGMQKRVSLARTIAVDPEILLFDEPTTGLDPVTTNAVNQLILDLSRKLGTTSLVVSHDMHCALGIADKIIVLDKGKILEQGTPQDLKNSSEPLVQDFLREALDANLA